MRSLNLRRNQLYFVADALGWPLGQSFLSPQTILPMFVARLSGSNLMVGLIGAIQSLAQLLPQVVASSWIERLPLLRRYVFVVAILAERLPLLLVIGALLAGASAPVVLALFFVAWIAVNLGTGINMPAFMAMFGKCIPAVRRGRVMGVGTAVGTLLAAGGALLARYVLEHSDGLRGYAWCFLVGLGVLMLSVLPLAFVEEPEGRAARPASVRSHLRESLRMVGRDADFVRYLVMQLFLQLGLASIAFVTSYAVMDLEEGEGSVAVGSGLLMLSHALGSLGLGLWADRRGYRGVYVAGGASGLLMAALMLFSPSFAVVLGVYALGGVFMSSLSVGGNMSIEFAPPHRTATYTAVSFTAVAPVRALAPVALGLLADRAGTVSVFAVVTAFCAAALAVALFALRDPRRRSEGAGHRAS